MKVKYTLDFILKKKQLKVVVIVILKGRNFKLFGLGFCCCRYLLNTQHIKYWFIYKLDILLNK